MNPKLALLAASAKLDAFTAVKADIDKLVAEYQQQQKDEIDQRDWCIAELNTNERDTAAADDKAAGLQAKIADLTKTIEGLTADLKATADANAEMQTQMKRASETREGESAANRQTIDDQRVTQMILGKAIDRMMQTYQADKLSIGKLQATLVQGAPHTQTSATHTDPGNGPAAFANNAEQNSGGNRVIAMLEEVTADSKKTEEETMASEEDSQSAYENFMKDSNKSIQHNLESITNMQEAKAKANDSLIQAKTDLKQTVAELGALHETNGDLHKSCDYVMKNFEARQAARQAEIEAMKEAKNILSGMK
jgi:septal ring factor EnvC (AmiA/AmiB activator)